MTNHDRCSANHHRMLIYQTAPLSITTDFYVNIKQLCQSPLLSSNVLALLHATFSIKMYKIHVLQLIHNREGVEIKVFKCFGKETTWWLNGKIFL